jgi:hypothetical protein
LTAAAAWPQCLQWVALAEQSVAAGQGWCLMLLWTVKETAMVLLLLLEQRVWLAVE